MRKQSALTQWQMRTRAECRTTTRGTAIGRAEDAEGMDVIAMTPLGPAFAGDYGRAGRKFRQARQALAIFLGGRRNSVWATRATGRAARSCRSFAFLACGLAAFAFRLDG